MLKSLALWLGLLVLAIVNGTAREKVLLPALGERIALPLSGLVLSILILAATWAAIPLLGRLNAAQYWLIGGLWLVLTAAFDFLFGHYLGGKSWQTLLAAYSPAHGNLWLLILAATAAAPYLAARIRALV